MSHQILDRPEPPKPTGKWLSIKLLGYGLAIALVSWLLLNGADWLMAMYNLHGGTMLVVYKLLTFLSVLAFVVFNIMGLQAAVVYLSGGKNQDERTAGWIGFFANLACMGLVLLVLWVRDWFF